MSSGANHTPLVSDLSPKAYTLGLPIHLFPQMQEFLERNNLWRDAADVVQLLRSTGGRLNEIVCIRLDQLMRTKRKLGLYATKTENQRDLPLWDCIKEIAQRRIQEGLTDGELLFPRAKTATFDNSIARACRKAAQLAKLSRTNGFSCHSLRHTFITDMMEARKQCGAGHVL